MGAREERKSQFLVVTVEIRKSGGFFWYAGTEMGDARVGG